MNIDELRKQLDDLCEKSQTSKSGMTYLVNYYINNLGWSEEEAYKYACGLFKNGVIQEIKLFGQDGKEL